MIDAVQCGDGANIKVGMAFDSTKDMLMCLREMVIHQRASELRSDIPMPKLSSNNKISKTYIYRAHVRNQQCPSVAVNKIFI